MKSRIMYIESKGGGPTGPARIGHLTFSKSGATPYHAGKAFQGQTGRSFVCNYFEVDSGDAYRISGPYKDGENCLYTTDIRPLVDANEHDAYWREIRELPVPQRRAGEPGF